MFGKVQSRRLRIFYCQSLSLGNGLGGFTGTPRSMYILKELIQIGPAVQDFTAPEPTTMYIE